MKVLEKNAAELLAKSQEHSFALMEADSILVSAWLDGEHLSKRDESISADDHLKYIDTFSRRYGMNFESVCKVVTHDIQKRDIPEDELYRRLSVIQIKKSMAYATEILVEYMRSKCWDMCWRLSDLTGRLSSVSDKDEYRDAIMAPVKHHANVLLLNADLGFMEFVNGELATDESESTSSSESVSKYCGDGYPSDCGRSSAYWDVQYLNSTIKCMKDAQALMKALKETMTGQAGAEPFMGSLDNAIASGESFIEYWPVIIEALKDSRYTEIHQIDKSASDNYLDLVPSVEKSEKMICYIEKADEKLGLVYGVVLKPGTEKDRDLQKQWIEADAIEETMRMYMEEYQIQGEMHQSWNDEQGVSNPDYRLIQNFIAPVDFEYMGKEFKKGSWIQEWKILSPLIKQKVFSGIYKGFSVGGVASIIPDKKKSKE